MKISTSKVMQYVPKSVLRTASRQVLLAKKNSPHIFFGLGVAGVVTSAVLACRATLKLSDTMDEIKKEVDQLERPERLTNAPMEFHPYPLHIYRSAAWKVTKLYGPSVLLGTASIGALTGSHVQLVRRNTALMAAYAAVQKAYDDYRDRVRDQLGEERELDIYHAATNKVVIDKDGKKTETKMVDPNKYSPYAKFFDEFSPNWNRDPELNRLFCQAQQNYANNLLHARGHVFLNECYDMLGIERSSAGQVVGWVRHNEEGDNYVSFGIFEAFNSAFVNGNEQSILLDFNVDGVIWDKI